MRRTGEDIKFTAVNTHSVVSNLSKYSYNDKYISFFRKLDSPAAVYHVINDGEDFIFADVNEAAEEFDNIEKENVVGKNILDVFPKTSESGLLELMRRVWQSGYPERFHVKLYQGDHIVSWRDCFVFKLGCEEIGAVCFSETKKRKTEQKLELISQAIEQSGEGIAIFDTNGCFKFVNSTMEKMHGFNKGELIGKHHSVYIPDDQKHNIDFFKNKMQQNGLYDADSFHKRKDGSIFPVHVHGTVLANSDSSCAGVLISVRDITKRRKAVQKLREQRRNLRELTNELSLSEERQRRKIAGNLHDQLSQILAVAVMRLELVKESCDTELEMQIRDITDSIHKAIDSVRKVIYDLSSSTLYRFGLKAAIFEYISNIFQKYEEIKCIFISDEKEVLLKEEIQILIFQSVRELLFNVIKYAQAGKVIVEMKAEGDFLTVSVTDDGIGFDVSKAGLLNKSGGFGLFHIKERLVHIGGLLKIESQPDKGSRFYLKVPFKNGI